MLQEFGKKCVELIDQNIGSKFQMNQFIQVIFEMNWEKKSTTLGALSKYNFLLTFNKSEPMPLVTSKHQFSNELVTKNTVFGIFCGKIATINQSFRNEFPSKSGKSTNTVPNQRCVVNVIQFIFPLNGRMLWFYCPKNSVLIDFSGIRKLFTQDSLGITAYMANREIEFTYTTQPEQFKDEFRQYIDQTVPLNLLIENLKRYLHLMSARSDDVELLWRALRLLKTQRDQWKRKSQLDSKNDYIFGPIIMRALAFHDLPEYAMKVRFIEH